MPTTYLKPAAENFPVELFTWRDLIVEVNDWANTAASAGVDRRVRAATLNGMRDLCSRRDWKFLVEQRSIKLPASIELEGYYDHTGGSSERLFTITDATALPSEPGMWNVVIDQVTYEISGSSSGTTFNLTERSNPNGDVGTVLAPETVTLVRNTYACPGDFIKAYDPQSLNANRTLAYLSPSDYVEMISSRAIYGEPRYWTVMPHERLYGQRAIRVFPFPSVDRLISIMYRKMPRPLRVSGMSPGEYGTFTLDTGTDANRAAVTGITVSSKLIGCVFRMRSDTNTPENSDGRYPYEDQAVVVDVHVGSGYLYLDRDLTTNYTAKACVVSDPVDVPVYMLGALKQDCMYQYAKLAQKSWETIGPLRGLLTEEMIAAAENDTGYVPGSGAQYPWHFQDDNGAPTNVESV
jgi:hypothetical protein